MAGNKGMMDNADPAGVVDGGRYAAICPSPVGLLGIDVDGDAVTGLHFLAGQALQPAVHGRVAERVVAELQAWFADPDYRFSVPVRVAGTAFQRRVWGCLSSIRRGQTRTYGDVARELHSGARAVGNACRANPVPLLVPCHRVVAARSPGGFFGRSAAGARIKHWLLAHEQETA